ncbi:cytochrome P450 [Agrocybe pediades]|nr:cytochrome P450 [Agrocybe pediades]
MGSNSLVAIVLVPLLPWLIYKIIAHIWRTSTPLPYPPGPKPKPLIGNMFEMLQPDVPRAFAKLGKQYGSIVHLRVMGQHFVVLNSFEDAEELLEKRAGIYSDRPVLPIVKLMGWEYNFALLPHNDEWRQHRKMAHQHFRAAEAVKYLPTQRRKVCEFLQDLMVTPEQFHEHSKKLSIAIPLSTMYGYDITSLDDPCIAAADESALLGGKLLAPGQNFIDIFPILGRVPEWFPGAVSVRMAAKTKRLTEEVKRIPMEHAKKMMEKGQAKPSLVTEFLEKKWRVGASKEEEGIVQNIANTVYGVDCRFSGLRHGNPIEILTISVTGAFMFFMVTNPDLQRKAQAEIDRVVGSNRLPDITDRPNMPYIEALYREVMRMGLPLPLALPHVLSEDDCYKGYFLPKGALVLPNIWAMNHDEQKYAEPFNFRPERFIDDSGQLNDDSRILAYGFGRRVCVGKYIASSTMWLIIASVLACFDIVKAKDEHGQEIEVDDSIEDHGPGRHRARFQCTFVARSPEALNLINEAVNADT